MSEPSPAIVLLSGGLDSATALAIAKADGHAPLHALSFDYGQRHAAELQAAHAVAQHLGVSSHQTVTIDLRAFGGSALTDDIPVPKDNPALTTAPRSPRTESVGEPADASADSETDIPVTYVPARNTIFLAYALALAEVKQAQHIYLGINAVDYSGYPDCRPAYLDAVQHVAHLATKAGIEGDGPTLHAPLIELTKTQIIQRGLDLGVDYSLTHSCYDPQPPLEPGGRWRPCGRCDACLIRQAAFAELGMTDPVLES
ncbi:MAG: 7-cyano-7-deazaguanine synthase QueC [Planctomycetota bacterium]